MRQVKLEDLAKEVNVKFAVTTELAKKVIHTIAPEGVSRVLVVGNIGYMYYRPKNSTPLGHSYVGSDSFFQEVTAEEIELICQDFQTVVDIWSWLFAKEGNEVKGEVSGSLYLIKGGRVYCDKVDVSEEPGTFRHFKNFSKVTSWKDKLSKERPLLCWVGDSEILIQKKWTIARIVGHHSDKYITPAGRGWLYAESLTSEELEAFLATNKETV